MDIPVLHFILLILKNHLSFASYLRFMVKPHTSDIRIHTGDIRVHTDDIRVHTSNTWVTCEYIRVTYGRHTIIYK